MQEKYRLSPWCSKFDRDDSFNVNVFQLKCKTGDKINILSNRVVKNLTKTCKINRKATSSSSRKQNKADLQTVRIVQKSCQNSPSIPKKVPIRLKMITNNNKLNLIPQKPSKQTVRDSHDMLVQKLLKLKRDGKLQLKQNNCQRILRF